jgi:UDP-3-O-[3-hydroxymyristoyl] glucosamine N-acyltransferase
MADARFFTKAGPFNLSELARIAGAELAGAAKGEMRFSDVKPLSAAGPDDVSFVDNRRYLAEFASTRAGAILAAPENASRAPAGAALLLTKDPYRGYALVAQAFYPSA